MTQSNLPVTPGTGTKVDGTTTATQGNFRQTITIGDPSIDANVATVDPTYGVSVNVKGVNGAAPNMAQETGGNLATLAGVVSSNKAAVKSADGDQATIGAKADTAITDSTTTNTHMSFLKGLVKIFADVWDSVNHRLNVYLQNTSIAVTGTFWQATQPVSGTVTANAGTGTFGVNVAQINGNTPLASGQNGSLAVGGNVPSGNTLSSSVYPIQLGGSDYGGTPHAQVAKIDASGNLYILATLQAGSNIAGKLGIDQTTPGTTNGVQVVPSSSAGWSFAYQAGGINATKYQVKGSAGSFGGYIFLFNPNTATTYIQVFNKTSTNVTVGTTTPDFVIPLPGVASGSGTGSGANSEIVVGVPMSNGITVAATTTETGSTSPSSNVFATFLYK